ncbi:hypothetical protein [Paenibacillus sp. B2(2019)]|uniref:hypothetical protein n=1 Tax=Paenibacillus sp. B2(2019) TaxID=2607754 RepID=UPI0011F1783C|nr:hypothetical protein [Paenibacillus sp. B2(2019)]KAA1177487.1 hypothetical protein PAENI_30230 [Paenibacillus sp. B2(2019)]
MSSQTQKVKDALMQKGLPTTQSSADSNAVWLARDTINAYTDITKSMLSQYNVREFILGVYSLVEWVK